MLPELSYSPEDAEPITFDFDMRRKRVRLFVGDRWQTIGELDTYIEDGYIQIAGPDIESFLDEHAMLDDGVAEWAEWGAQLN